MWWKNLKGGTPVGIRIRGGEHSGEALTVTGGETLIENLGAFLSRYPGKAYRYGVGLDAVGQPDKRDIITAVERSDSVMIYIRPT